jgi:hypothetical protein
LLLFCPPVIRAQAGGIAPEWEVRKNLEALAAHSQRLEPILDQIRPQEWISQGAPEAYIAQVKNTREQLQALAYSADKLVQEPDRLTAALDAFFRIEALEAMLRSLGAGVRKYQNPALADLLQSAVAEGTTHREKLRQYIVELAADREQQFKVVDQEAQRCRAILSRQPAAKSEGKNQERR